MSPLCCGQSSSGIPQGLTLWTALSTLALPVGAFAPYFGKSNTTTENLSYGSVLYVHSVPVAQPSAIPTAPGVHLSGGCQGQVVVTVRMGSNFDNVSGGKTLDQLWSLKG